MSANPTGDAPRGDAANFAEIAPDYLATRFKPDPRRERVWGYISAYLARWWEHDASVLDVGAGYCSFINQVHAKRRVAVDVHSALHDHAAPGVECLRASATRLPFADSESFDVVLASNLLEHLSRSDILLALKEFRRVMSERGRLILIQPNYRLCASRYFDDFTHLTPLSDVSLVDTLGVSGFRVVHVQPRFLPLTVKSRFSVLTPLVPIYLRSPIRPRAGQMLVVAEPR